MVGMLVIPLLLVLNLSLFLDTHNSNGSAGRYFAAGAINPSVVKATADRYSLFGPEQTVQSYSDSFYTTVQKGLIQQYSTFLTRFQDAINQLTLLKYDTQLANVSWLASPPLPLPALCVNNSLSPLRIVVAVVHTCPSLDSLMTKHNTDVCIPSAFPGPE